MFRIWLYPRQNLCPSSHKVCQASAWLSSHLPELQYISQLLRRINVLHSTPYLFLLLSGELHLLLLLLKQHCCHVLLFRMGCQQLVPQDGQLVNHDQQLQFLFCQAFLGSWDMQNAKREDRKMVIRFRTTTLRLQFWRSQGPCSSSDLPIRKWGEEGPQPERDSQEHQQLLRFINPSVACTD